MKDEKFGCKRGPLKLNEHKNENLHRELTVIMFKELIVVKLGSGEESQDMN